MTARPDLPLLGILLTLCLLGGPAVAGERDDVRIVALQMGYNGQAQAGLTRLRPWLADHPADTEAAMTAARLLAWSGQTDAAAGQVRDLLTQQPDNADLLTLAGDIVPGPCFRRTGLLPPRPEKRARSQRRTGRTDQN